MSFWHELIFDVVIDGLYKLSDKLRETRPEKAKNGTAAEWIVCICMLAAVIAYFAFQISYAREDANEVAYYSFIAVLVIAGALIAMILLRHYLRWRKKRKDKKDEWL